MKIFSWIKRDIYIISLTLLFILSILFSEMKVPLYMSISTMSVLTLLSGFHIFKKALIDLKYKMIGIDLLVTIAVVAAFIIGDYFEAAAVTYLFTLGHYLEKKSLEKTRSALASLIDLKPALARIMKDKTEELIAVDLVRIGDILLVKPGEKIPTDGIITEGIVMVDEQMITGESIPVHKSIGDKILGSTVLTSGYSLMEVTSVGEDTTLARMIHMVEEAQDQKAKTQKFMEVFAKYYTPGVVVLSIIIFLITFDLRLAITMLVIACPGALVIATPVSFVAGIGNAAKKGILFKGGDSIERLAKGNLVFFDKTGTLTKGKPELKVIKSFKQSEHELIRIAAIGEAYSEHPLSKAIIDKAKDLKLDLSDQAEDIRPIIGKGIEFEYNKVRYQIGNRKLIKIDINEEVNHLIGSYESHGYTTLIMADEKEVLGLFGIADAKRDHVEKLIEELKGLKITDVIMLTGDQKSVAKSIADEIGIQTYHASMLPEDKANVIKSYQERYHTIFVGDGINDALALAYADASVAVGGIGKDLAMETADVVLMGEDLLKLKDAIKISRKVKTNMLQNIIFALVVVAFLMVGVIFEVVTMSIGMLVHELSVLIVLMNAIRLLKYDRGGLNGKRFRTQ